MGIATVEAVLANLPGWHAFELHFDKATDFVFADVGCEATGEVVENLGVFGEDDSGTTNFFDNGADYILLILHAMAIAGGIRFALASKSKRHGTVHVDIPLWNRDMTIGPRHKLLIGININAADCINQVYDGRKVDFEIIIDFDVEQIFESLHGHLYAIDASMGKFVAVASSTVELNVIIARNGRKQNFVSFWVDGGKHIDVAAATLHVGHITISINTANENCEWFGSDINIDFVDGAFGVDANFDGIEYAGGSTKTLVAIFGKVV